MVIKKSSVENNHSNSGVPSGHLVESWVVQSRPRICYELRCGVLTSGE
jgi:hypothetical protein